MTRQELSELLELPESELTESQLAAEAVIRDTTGFFSGQTSVSGLDPDLLDELWSQAISDEPGRQRLIADGWEV